jgi:uncharacterized protein (TIGR03067 family)
VERQKKAMEANGTLVYKTKQQEEESRQRLKNYEEGKPFRRQGPGGTEKGATKGDDEKALQGTWRAVSIEAEGVKNPVEGPYTLTFQEGKVHQLHKTTNGADFHYTLKLDSGKSPKTIDMTITQAGSEKDKGEVGKTILGVYALEGDELKLCTDPTVRPTAFDTKGKGPDTVLMMLKREKK